MATIEPIFGARAPVTLQTHILDEERRFPESGGTLSWIFSALAIAAKTISAKLKCAGLDDILGDVGTENVQGERQQKLDVIANEVLIQVLRGRDGVAVIGSEEDEELIFVERRDGSDRAGYAVMFDPLDGSSNLDVCGGVGTIFSIFACGEDGALRPGRDQIAAGYVLYGPSTVFVTTTGNGVHMFVLDTSVGAFIRVAEFLRIPETGKVYSVNEANLDGFPEGYRRFLAQCRDRGYSSRYAGAMVADVHRVLLKGGIFMYPPTAKAPDGKLRLMYEANPMAFIVEQAGGAASTGRGDILDVLPEALHQRVPVIIGSQHEVEALVDALR